MTYDDLKKEAEHLGLVIYEKPINGNIKGLYGDGVILINSLLSTDEKLCVLAEELGHFFTSEGIILDQSTVLNRKQEIRARAWAYEKLVPLQKIVQACLIGVSSICEFAELLSVTEKFVESAVKWYQQKYGYYVAYKNYIITFNPLHVYERGENNWSVLSKEEKIPGA